MRAPRIFASSLLLVIMACSDPFPCTRYCWSHRQHVADLTDEAMTGGPDGRFDGQCTLSSGSDSWNPPLPPFGWYAAEECLPADAHGVIAETVASIQDPTVDASAACDVSDLQVYADLVQDLAARAREACVDHLTCKRSPAGCDIDPTMMGNQACTILTAEALCDQAVLAPALAALNDLSNGPGAAQPQPDGTVIQYVDDPQDCVPLLEADTDGTPVCPEPGGGEGLDTSGSDDGLDESSSGGMGVGPFGDVEQLVHCATPLGCVVEPELFGLVQANFAVFRDEGVWLERVELPGIGGGIQVSGLDRGEASHRLLGALGLHDGDVLTHVDGRSLVSAEAIEQVLLELPSATSWSVELRRKVGSRWVTLEGSITRAQ